jgi:hypothetical protein
MYAFPNHTFLLEKADTLLRDVREFSESAKREVRVLEEAVEDYVREVRPVFEDMMGVVGEEEGEEDVKRDSEEAKPEILSKILEENSLKNIIAEEIENAQSKSRSSVSSISSKNS